MGATWIIAHMWALASERLRTQGPLGEALELRRGSVLSWMVMGLMGDLASILKPMIAEMIKEVLQELLGGDGLKSMITGLLVGRQPGALTAGSGGTQSFASPKGKGKHADDGASAVAKAGRWQRGAKADVEGDDGQNGVSKHGGKGGQGAPGGKGNGKSSGDALAKGKGKDPGSAHAKGKGKGADLPDGDGGGEWTVVLTLWSAMTSWLLVQAARKRWCGQLLWWMRSRRRS